MHVFVFDIETVPDVEAGRRLYDLNDLSDAEVAQAMFTLRRQETNGSDFLRHYLHRIVAISVVFRSRETLKVWSLGTEESNEKELIQRFYAGIDKYTPNLVSWNGSGFDLPVLHYRTLFHEIAAPLYWEMGENDQNFRWNNYLNRYHYRHMDLMDILAGYQARANTRLDDIASFLGFPGKMGMSGDKVWDAYQKGNIREIRDYCETDVLNTFLVYCRFEFMRGHLTETAYQQDCELVKACLKEENKPHLQHFLSNWEASSPLPQQVD